jgi:hypothetical protein
LTKGWEDFMEKWVAGQERQSVLERLQVWQGVEQGRQLLADWKVVAGQVEMQLLKYRLKFARQSVQLLEITEQVRQFAVQLLQMRPPKGFTYDTVVLGQVSSQEEPDSDFPVLQLVHISGPALEQVIQLSEHFVHIFVRL